MIEYFSTSSSSSSCCDDNKSVCDKNEHSHCDNVSANNGADSDLEGGVVGVFCDIICNVIGSIDSD